MTIFPLSCPRRRFWTLATFGLATTLLAAPASAESITLYNAQHEQMVSLITDAFTKQTGIGVDVRSGEPPALASQLLKEGDASPADVYFTANSPELVLLSEQGRLAKLNSATLEAVPAANNSPAGDWVGVLARENVLAFNPTLIEADKLPAALLDLAKPEWKGRIAIAPTDADFLPLVGAIVALKGRPVALDWLKSLHVNAQVFDDNEGVMAAVDRGAVATGIVNNYYWARLGVEVGFDKLHSRLHQFAAHDVGSLVNVSGAGVLANAPHAAAAQRFVAFLVSRSTQEMLARTDVGFEYPLVDGVAPNSHLVPFTQLQPPSVTLQQIGDDKDAAALLREAGLI